MSDPTSGFNLAPENRKVDRWVKFSIFLGVVQLAILLFPYLRPGKIGLVCWYFAFDLVLWLGLGLIVGAVGIVVSLRWRPIVSRWRVAGFVVLASLLFVPLTFNFLPVFAYPSSHSGSQSKVPFRLPMDGPVSVGWGGDSPWVNRHAGFPSQRWAYDLLVIHDGRSFASDGRKLEDYYCYGQPVLAPADGVIIAVFGDDPEVPIGQLGGGTSPMGNHIVLEVAANEFLFLCHLQPGSILVEPGAKVVAGRQLARIGNSGNTSEPHLHVHLQDSLNFDFGEGIPLYFHDYRVNDEYVERGMPRGGIENGQWAGQTVEHVGPVGRTQ